MRVGKGTFNTGVWAQKVHSYFLIGQEVHVHVCESVLNLNQSVLVHK